MEKMNGISTDIVGQNIERLKELFPEVVTEDKIDFDVLRETLGYYVDDRQERYSFTWNGKARARRIAQTPSMRFAFASRLKRSAPQVPPCGTLLKRSAPYAFCRMKLVLRLDVGRWSMLFGVWEIVKNNDLGRRLLLSEKSCIYCNKSCIYCNKMLVIVKLFNVNPNVAKVESAADPRRQGCSCSNLPQGLDNAGDAVPSAFP